MKISTEERILTALFLCSNEANDVLKELKPAWNDHVDLPINKKSLIINYSSLIEEVFPWRDALSDEIDYEKFAESFFVQPDLFLRLRPEHDKKVKEKLKTSEINFNELSPSCLALPNNSKLSNIIKLDTEAVVQDYSSQRTGDFFSIAIDHLRVNIHVWDCCAGSGGKALLLYDLKVNIDLTVSDVRESILVNLEKRFKNAGIKKYRSFVADLTQNNLKPQESKYDLIICDAPCTGSGTWSRTPEQLCFFDEKETGYYSSLQRKIVSNIIPSIKGDGFLIYITCSVFKQENEEVVEFIKNSFPFELIKMEWLKGYDKKADTMFVSVLKKNNITR